MEIESGSIYDHREYGEVLVLGIHRRYESYDLDTDTGVESGVVVRYARDWDEYGPMPSATTVDPIDQFTRAAEEKIRDDGRTATGPAESITEFRGSVDADESARDLLREGRGESENNN
ncbi:hypothetical protein [Halosimplex amylolyticum]|uniref:hypothetical protein n=1 Tax=Halosimplex amylolyticum TaxID=3396616 RepID=UPI003F575A3D